MQLKEGEDFEPMPIVMLPVEIEKQKIFVVQAEEVIRSYKLFKPNTLLARRLMEEPHDFIIEEFYGTDILMDIYERLYAGVSQHRHESRVLFLSFVRMLYMMLTDNQKIKCSRGIISEWQRLAGMHDYTQYFQNISENFDSNFESAVAILYDGENQDSQVVKDAKNAVRWAMTLSPFTTVFHLLNICVGYPKHITDTLELLDLVPDLFYDRNLNMWHRPTEIDCKEPLLRVVLRRLICDARTHLKLNEQWDAFVTLAMALISERGDGEKEKKKEPLMDQHHLLDMVLIELYSKNRAPMKSVEILTSIAARILSIDNRKELVYTFASSMRHQPEKEEKVLLTPTIIELIFDYLEEYQGKSKKIVANLKSMLKSIGQRIQKANVVFDVETRDRFFDKPMSWCIKFFFVKWFTLALGVDSEPVLLAILSEISKEEMREEEEYHLETHFLVAVLKFGLFDVDGALEVLESDHCLSFDEVDVTATILKTLQRNFEEKGIPSVEKTEIGELVKQIIRRVAPEIDIDVDGLLELIPEDVETTLEEERKIVNVPLNARVKSERIQALKEPVPIPWNPTPGVILSWHEIRENRRKIAERNAAIQRKSNELCQQAQDRIRQQWIAEGFITPKNDPRGRRK